MREQDYKSLSLTNDFIFAKVMQNPRLCKRMLEIILNTEIERIEYPEAQKVIDEKYDARSVRLDLYVKDRQDIIYNVEMQTTNPGNLPKRSRFYQEMIDLSLIEKGENFNQLNRCFVIFICLKDIFGKGRHIYTFENRCVQDTSVCLGDETVKIFLNPYSEMDDISKELSHFLRFLINGIPSDGFTAELAAAVEEVKNNKQWEVEYMTLYMQQQEVYREGLEKGREEGREEGREKGREEGLTVLVGTLKNVFKDFDKVYETVIQNDVFSALSREQVEKLYNQLS